MGMFSVLPPRTHLSLLNSRPSESRLFSFGRSRTGRGRRGHETGGSQASFLSSAERGKKSALLVAGRRWWLQEFSGSRPSTFFYICRATRAQSERLHFALAVGVLLASCSALCTSDYSFLCVSCPPMVDQHSQRHKMMQM
jgi:hypothetical protein